MTQTFKLDKETFIKRSMAGDVFDFDNQKYYYANTDNNPFRVNTFGIKDEWYNFNGINEFTLVEPEPEMESWAEFRVWNSTTETWYKAPSMFQTLDDFKEKHYQDWYSRHHEIPNTRVLLPKVV